MTDPPAGTILEGTIGPLTVAGGPREAAEERARTHFLSHSGRKCVRVASLRPRSHLAVESSWGRGYHRPMCRNIKTLYNFEPPASREEIDAAALQYVRKISGFNKPSQANAEAFEAAVEAVAEASAELLGRLVTSAPPKDREVEAAKRRARAEQRFAAA